MGGDMPKRTIVFVYSINLTLLWAWRELRRYIMIIADRFYIVLFSALEQTHCTHVACDSEWMTVSFYSAFFNIHQSDVVAAIFGCCMAGATWNRCRIGASSVYTIQSCTMHILVPWIAEEVELWKMTRTKRGGCSVAVNSTQLKRGTERFVQQQFSGWYVGQFDIYERKSDEVWRVSMGTKCRWDKVVECLQSTGMKRKSCQFKTMRSATGSQWSFFGRGTSWSWCLYVYLLIKFFCLRTHNNTWCSLRLRVMVQLDKIYVFPNPKQFRNKRDRLSWKLYNR